MNECCCFKSARGYACLRKNSDGTCSLLANAKCIRATDINGTREKHTIVGNVHGRHASHIIVDDVYTRKYLFDNPSVVKELAIDIAEKRLRKAEKQLAEIKSAFKELGV